MDSSSENEKFIRIVKDHKRILYKIIYSYCKDPEDRKDLEQEILIQLWKSLKHFNENFKLSTWIYKISLNVAISHYRKDVNRKVSSISLNPVIFQIAEDNPEVYEEINSRTEILNKFINQLDEFNKAIIILYLEDNSYREIAEILGISETNVGTKLNRIKNKLREYFSLANY